MFFSYNGSPCLNGSQLQGNNNCLPFTKKIKNDRHCLLITQEDIDCLQILQKRTKIIFQLLKKIIFVFELWKFPSSYKKIVFSLHNKAKNGFLITQVDTNLLSNYTRIKTKFLLLFLFYACVFFLEVTPSILLSSPLNSLSI